MLEKISARNAKDSAEASMGRVNDVVRRESSEPRYEKYFWSGLAVTALAAALFINTRAMRRRSEDSVERIPLVTSSSSIFESPNRSAKWQREAMARRGYAEQYSRGFGTSDSEASAV